MLVTRTHFFKIIKKSEAFALISIIFIKNERFARYYVHSKKYVQNVIHNDVLTLHEIVNPTPDGKVNIDIKTSDEETLVTFPVEKIIWYSMHSVN